MKVRIVGMLAAGLAALGLAVAPGAASADTLSANPCLRGAPAQAAQPVTCIPVSVWVWSDTRAGWVGAGCTVFPNAKEDPKTSEANWTTYRIRWNYKGWAYQDARGIVWASWTSDGQTAPWWTTYVQGYPVCENV